MFRRLVARVGYLHFFFLRLCSKNFYYLLMTLRLHKFHSKTNTVRSIENGIIIFFSFFIMMIEKYDKGQDKNVLELAYTMRIVIYSSVKVYKGFKSNRKSL